MEEVPADLVLFTAAFSLLGSEERVEYSSSSLCLATRVLENLWAARSRDLEVERAALAASSSARGGNGEEQTNFRCLAALRLDNWAAWTSGLIGQGLSLEGLERSIVLKHCSAARLSAWFVQSSRTDDREGEVGTERESCSKGRVEERRASY